MSTPDPIHEIFRLSRDFGSIQAEQVNLSRRLDAMDREIRATLDELKKSSKEQDDKLDQILEFQASMRGGWKGITLISSLIVSAAIFVGWLIDRWAAIRGAIF